VRETPAEPSRAGERFLVLALAALLAAVWLEAPGSALGEPDEARYAEIPREMIAAGDLVTPRLNGVPYFEKPPLLYWVNAASLSLFGETPFAARLPTRLFGTATAILLALAIGRRRGRAEGLAAAILFLAAPFGFAAARTNLTDGILTFFFAATLFAALGIARRAAENRPTAAAAAGLGALAAGGFLAKGLVAVVLPGAIVLAHLFATRRARDARGFLVSPAPLVFAALVAPWLSAAERAHPGFLRFFFVHEHFQRFATPAASRPGPVYYFAALFLAGFLPALPLFFAGWRRLRQDTDALFFALWFGIPLVFFSLSRSKLPPYIFPALPAAAALAARGFRLRRGSRGPWLAHAILAAVFLAACAATPAVRGEISASGIGSLALGGAVALAAGSLLALRARTSERALAAAGAGWAGLYAVLSLAWPHTSLARDVPDLAFAARDAAREGGNAVPVVGYRAYLQGFPWTLKSPIPVADYTGELEAWWLPENERRAIFWTRERFRGEWTSGRRMVALYRARDGRDLAAWGREPRVLVCRGKYCVAANW